MKPPRVIIEVYRGVVTGVYSNKPIDVDVLDHDQDGGMDVDDEVKYKERLEAEIKELKHNWP